MKKLRLSLVIVVYSFLSISFPWSVASAVDQRFNSSNNIFFYDKNFATCSGSSSSGPLSGSDNQAKIWGWFLSNGMSENGAAGIMGNMSPESGFNPFMIQKGGSLRTYDAMAGSDARNSAFGLVQWDGSRRPAVLKYITNSNPDYKQYVSDTYGKEIEDYKKAPPEVTDAFITLELEYIKQESTPGGGRSTVWNKMIEATSPGDAADTFEELFEGSVRDAGGAQHTDAESIYSQLTGSQSGVLSSSSTSSSTGCGSSSSPENLGPVASGGLNEAQAKKLVMNYGADKNGDSSKFVLAGSGNPSSGCPGGLLSNCTSFSAFFLNKFTSTDFKGGDGSEVVGNIGSDATKGSTPKVWAVFSMGSTSANGHTGVVLGIDGDTAIVGQASCGNPGHGKGNGTIEGGGAGFIKVGKLNQSGGAWYMKGVPVKFAYPKDVNISEIQGYINGS